MDAGNDNGGDCGGGYETDSSDSSQSDSGGGYEWLSDPDPAATGPDTDVSTYVGEGGVAGVEATASRDSSDSNNSGSDGMSLSGFDSGDSSHNGENSPNDNSIGDINIPSSLGGNSNGEGTRSENSSLVDALAKTAEVAIGTIEDAHKVAKVDMPKGLENTVKGASKALGAYNTIDYLVKYSDAIKKDDYRTAISESVNALVGATISLVPMGGPLLGIAVYEVMEYHDVGGWVYDKMDSLDIGVNLYDLINDENP